MPFVQHWNTVSLSSQYLCFFSISLKQWCVEGLLLPITVVLWPFPQHSFSSVSLWHSGQPPGLSCLQHVCFSHSEGWLSLRGCIFFFKLTFVFNAFPQFQSYFCRLLQKPSGALLSRKSVWLLSEPVRMISLKNKALGLGVVGVVAKEASLV